MRSTRVPIERCALMVRQANASTCGPLVWAVTVYRSATDRVELSHISPVCWWCGMQTVTHHNSSDDAAGFAVLSSLGRPHLTADDCIHGAGCPVHPRAAGVHQYDPTCPVRSLHTPHRVVVVDADWYATLVREAFPDVADDHLFDDTAPAPCGGGQDPSVGWVAAHTAAAGLEVSP